MDTQSSTIHENGIILQFNYQTTNVNVPLPVAAEPTAKPALDVLLPI